jgi:hypothetical protein
MANIRVAKEGGQVVDEVHWQAQELDIVERPNGPAMAAILAAGIGAFVLGLLTTWAAASESFAQDVLKLDNGVGPLSGKTTFAVIAYVVAWAVLTPVLWRRNLPFNNVMIVAGLLIAAGFVGTFPEFFEAFESE